MTARFETVTFDCADPRSLAAFWCAVLDYVVHADRDGEVIEIVPKGWPEDEEAVAQLRKAPFLTTLAFIRVPEGKSTKNRLHLEISSIDNSQQDELDRLLALGATKVDVGQGEGRSWVVLADPEGNEFCLLRSLAPGYFTL